VIKWKDDFKIGIDEIDEQHKQIFRIANEAYELLKDEFAIDKYDRIAELLEELKDYAKFHFSFEESYMQSKNYRGYFSHKLAHDSFVDKVNSYDLDEVDENQDQYILEILEFVVNWISQHSLVTDKKIVAQES